MSDPVAAPEPPERPEDVIGETLHYARDTLDELWGEGRTTKGIYIDPALAALAALVAAKETAERWIAAHDEACEYRRERDALAEALREIVDAYVEWAMADLEVDVRKADVRRRRAITAARTALAGLSEVKP